MYQYDDWRTLKKALNLTNKDVAEIVGLEEQSIKNQLSPKKKLPTWARGLIYGYVNGIENATSRQAAEDPGARVVLMHKDGRTTVKGCGCYLDGNLFKRHKDCKKSRENHTF